MQLTYHHQGCFGTLTGFLWEQFAIAQVADAIDREGPTHKRCATPKYRYDLQMGGRKVCGIQWWGTMEMEYHERSEPPNEGICLTSVGHFRRLWIAPWDSDWGMLLPAVTPEADRDALDEVFQDFQRACRQPYTGELYGSNVGRDYTLFVPHELYDFYLEWTAKTDMRENAVRAVPVPCAIVPADSGGFLWNGGGEADFCWGGVLHPGNRKDDAREVRDSHAEWVGERGYALHHMDMVGGGFLWDIAPLVEGVPTLRKCRREWAKHLKARRKEYAKEGRTFPPAGARGLLTSYTVKAARSLPVWIVPAEDTYTPTGEAYPPFWIEYEGSERREVGTLKALPFEVERLRIAPRRVWGRMRRGSRPWYVDGYAMRAGCERLTLRNAARYWSLHGSTEPQKGEFRSLPRRRERAMVTDGTYLWTDDPIARTLYDLYRRGMYGDLCEEVWKEMLEVARGLNQEPPPGRVIQDWPTWSLAARQLYWWEYLLGGDSAELNVLVCGAVLLWQEAYAGLEPEDAAEQFRSLWKENSRFGQFLIHKALAPPGTWDAWEDGHLFAGMGLARGELTLVMEVAARQNVPGRGVIGPQKGQIIEDEPGFRWVEGGDELLLYVRDDLPDDEIKDVVEVSREVAHSEGQIAGREDPPDTVNPYDLNVQEEVYRQWEDGFEEGRARALADAHTEGYEEGRRGVSEDKASCPYEDDVLAGNWDESRAEGYADWDAENSPGARREGMCAAELAGTDEVVNPYPEEAVHCRREWFEGLQEGRAAFTDADGDGDADTGADGDTEREREREGAGENGACGMVEGQNGGTTGQRR